MLKVQGSQAWWTRSQTIRTEGEMLFEVARVDLQEPPSYQKISEKAAHLRHLGMNPNRIAGHLGVDRTTVTRALRWLMSESAYRPQTPLLEHPHVPEIIGELIFPVPDLHWKNSGRALP